jgi:fructan beta-fructosidase
VILELGDIRRQVRIATRLPCFEFSHTNRFRSNMNHRLLSFSLAFQAFAFAFAINAAEPDIVFADFEGSDYGAWKAEGEAFGKGPAQGTLPSQMPVSVSRERDWSIPSSAATARRGKLTSPKFRIERKYVGFLIGGGGFEGKTCMNLIVDR